MQVCVVYKHKKIYTPKSFLILYCTHRTGYKIKFIKSNLHALKCSQNRHTVCCKFRRFLKAITKELLYRLKFELAHNVTLSH